MLRSSSMLITRARSVRNATKLPFRFTFDILIDCVDKVAMPGLVVLVWERSSTKMLSTKAVTVDRNTRKACFGNEQLSSEVTLFKNSPQDKKFQEKVVKLAIKSGNAEGKTLGKIHLNLADHAELPSGSKKISAELNNGSVLIATVQCHFISMGRATTGKQGRSGEDGDESDEDDAKSTVSVDDSPSSAGLKSKLKLGRMGSKKGISRKGRDSGTLTEISSGNSDSTTLDKLKKENARLRKQLEEAEKALGREVKLLDENKALKREIEILKETLQREPEFETIVAQLKESKMALALLQLERDQLALEVMNMQRGEASTPRTV